MTEPTLKIVKPNFLEKFKSKRPPDIGGVETLLTALPISKIGDVGDWARLHPSEDEYWTPELCFVSVPIKGTKRDMLHLIDEDIAMEHLAAKKIQRFRLALASKPHDVFFFCIVPSQNLDNPWNQSALEACETGQDPVDAGVVAQERGGRRLFDQARPERGRVPASEMAIADARRIDRGHVPRGQYRARSSSGPASPDRRQAGSGMTAPGVENCFRTIIVVDFEYEIVDGGLPHVLCMVAYVLDWNLRHIRTIRLWRGEFGATPPFDIGPDALIVGYALWAEMTCFLQLGWRFPVHVYDLHTAYLSVSNILLPYNPDEIRKKPRKNLAAACCAYGIEGWEKIDKPGMAKAIGEGRWREYGQPAVFEYCEEDVRNSAELLRRQLSGYRNYAPIDPQRVMYWSEYSAKTVARIQAEGMPIDMPLWNLIQENKTAVIARADRAI